MAGSDQPSDQPSRRRPWRMFGRALAASTTSPTNLGVAGAAAIAAAALASWPVAAIGGLAYGALVAFDLASESHWKKVLAKDKGAALPTVTPSPGLDPGKIKDRGISDSVRAIVEAQRELAGTLEDTPDDIRATLTGTILQVEELQRLATMVARGADVAGYLVTVDRAAVRNEIASIEARLRATRDPEAKRQYEEARAAKLGQEQSLAQIGDQYDRILAKLTLVGATLEALPAKVVRMRALDAAARDELSGSVSAELQQMNGDIKVFEETFESLAEVENA